MVNRCWDIYWGLCCPRECEDGHSQALLPSSPPSPAVVKVHMGLRTRPAASIAAGFITKRVSDRHLLAASLNRSSSPFAGVGIKCTEKVCPVVPAGNLLHNSFNCIWEERTPTSGKTQGFLPGQCALRVHRVTGPRSQCQIDHKTNAPHL